MHILVLSNGDERAAALAAAVGDGAELRDGDAVLADVDRVDGVLYRGELGSNLRTAFREKAAYVALIAISDDAEAAMDAGADACCAPSVEPSIVANIVRRAVYERRRRMRWPRSFGQRDVLLLSATSDASHPCSAALARIADVHGVDSFMAACHFARDQEVHVAVIDASADGSPEGSAAVDPARVVTALRRYDPSIACVVLAHNKKTARVLKKSGAAVTTDRDDGGAVATLVERGWLSWCKARARSAGAGSTPFAMVARRLHEIDARRIELIKKLAEAHLELDKIATIDSVTEMLNRRGLEAALAREIEIARRTGGSVAACFVDCDDFNRVNERFGHNAGDVVLRNVAERLKHALRLSDTIGRVGGDEFLMLLPQTRIAEALLVAERARVTVSEEPVAIDDGPVHIGVSIGVVVIPWEMQSLDEVLPVARMALRESKRAGKNQVSGADGAALTDGTALSGSDALTPAIEIVINDLVSGDALRAVAQPIVRVSDEQVVGYEMLSRGRQGLFEAPDQFLRVARDRGVLTTVDMRCLEVCLVEARKAPADVHVHVNLFPSTLLDVPIEQLVRLLNLDDGAPLCLELSEEQFIGDPRELLERIAALRASGVRLAIDDVGKGRGTLDSVMLLEPDVVKIDRELISDAYKDVRKERLLRRLVSLASTLNCEVVGEGVEQEGDLSLLRELDVPYAQGFFWSRPLAYDTLVGG
jgi:diguanylate cyclase (GGDEF)-like protein